MRRLVFGICTLLSISALLYGHAKTSSDNWIGVWKMNVAKSKYEAGSLPKTRILSFEPLANGVKVSSDLLDVQGSVHLEFSVSYDGKDVAMRGAMPGSTIAATRIDAFTFETVQKTDGKVGVRTHFVVSLDGKMLTATAIGLDQNGAKYTNLSVYDRQP